MQERSEDQHRKIKSLHGSETPPKRRDHHDRPGNNETGNNFHANRDPFDRNARTRFRPDCNDCGLNIHEEIGYHEPSPKGWKGYLYWCRPCAAEMGVGVNY